MFENGGRTLMTDGRRLDGYTVSSPCEPNGSGELTSMVHELNSGYRLETSDLQSRGIVPHVSLKQKKALIS